MSKPIDHSLNNVLNNKLAHLALRIATVSTWAAEARKLLDEGAWLARSELQCLYLDISRLDEAIRDLKYIRMRQERRLIQPETTAKAQS